MKEFVAIELPIVQKRQNKRARTSLVLLSVIVLLRLLWIAYSCRVPPEATISDWREIRLPPWIVPSHYKLDVTTRLSSLAYEGSVEIAFSVLAASSFVVLHQKGLEVAGVTVSKANKTVSILRTEYRPSEEYLVIFLADKLVGGDDYRVACRFASKLTNSLQGFYYSSFNSHGTEHLLATTQFEPVYARQAFPCFDEPDKKAVFTISVSCEPEYHALSNMPLIGSSVVDGLVVHDFEPTVRMSTYLVAYVVSDFDYIEASTDNGVVVRVFTRQGETSLGEYALGTAVSVLDFYQQTYGIPYPLPKLDLIAIPDFAAGAMENWGLVTYRDTALLYNKKTSTSANKQRVATVVAHELAHQWTGNLVTMSWWSDLWLNEGFAEFMEYKGTDAAEPSWQMDEQFVYTDLGRALNADESILTHPIAIPVINPDEIKEIFDDISYGKGSSVLRMLESFLDQRYGSDYFFGHLSTYLTSHAYGNAQTSDLWEALRNKDDSVDVGQVMSTWTDQPGYPVISVSQVKLDSTGNAVFGLSQTRFLFAQLIDPLEGVDRSLIPPYVRDVDPASQLWLVPFSFSVYSNASGRIETILDNQTYLLDSQQAVVALPPGTPKEAVVIGNSGRKGVYRIHSDATHLKYLLEWLQADPTAIPAADRAGLITDVYSLAFSGQIKDVRLVLEITKLLEHEQDPLVWTNALGEMNTFKKAFAHHPIYGLIVRFHRGVLSKLVRRIGWEEKSSNKSTHHIRGLARNSVLQEAVRLGHAPTIRKAMKYFEKLRRGKKVSIDSDLLGVVYNAAVQYGGESNYEWVLNEYKESTFAPDQQRLLFALASSPVSYLQMRTLNLTLSGEIRKQDVQSLIENVASITPVGHLTSWVFLMDNWKAVTNIWKDGDFSKFNDILEDIIGKFTNSYLLLEAKRLFIDRKDPSFFMPPNTMISVIKGLETSRELLHFQKLAFQDVKKWLENELDAKDSHDDQDFIVQ